ncbi:MAG TPA: lipoate--protein ligase family protein [bacterium]
MRFLELTLPTPQENLACDEALLDACDEGDPVPVLRVWEPGSPFVVLGYSRPMADEADLAACRARAIPVLRRASGGGTVLQSPGGLNYALILPFTGRGPLESVSGAMRFVLEAHRRALEPLLGSPVGLQGYSDLTLGDRKFSGNAQRRRRRAVLIHGSFLLNADLALMTTLLPPPAQQPAYRNRRSHHEFLTNLGIPAARLIAILREAWRAVQVLEHVPVARIERLVRTRYTADAWTRKF